MVALVVRLVIITLLVYAGVYLWYGRVEDRLQEQVPAQTKTPPAAALPQPQSEAAPEGEEETPAANDYQVILTRNIFKAALESGDQAAGDESQTQLDDLAETKLHLALLGTVTGAKDDARAIIRDEKNQLEDLYQVGSEIQGAIITRISRGKVVLQVNGRDEVLNIKDPQEDGQRSERAGKPATAAPAMAAPSAAPDRAVERQAPEAMPRRRISFRGANPPPVAAPNEDKPPDSEPEPSVDAQPVPDDESAPPQARETENDADQQPTK